jgi:hypothetical protein
MNDCYNCLFGLTSNIRWIVMCSTILSCTPHIHTTRFSISQCHYLVRVFHGESGLAQLTNNKNNPSILFFNQLRFNQNWFSIVIYLYLLLFLWDIIKLKCLRRLGIALSNRISFCSSLITNSFSSFRFSNYDFLRGNN